MNYLALDVATTTGLAWSDKENNIYTKYHKGTPLELFEVAKLVVTSYEIDLVLIEKLNYFSLKLKKVQVRYQFLLYLKELVILNLNLKKLDLTMKN